MECGRPTVIHSSGEQDAKVSAGLPPIDETLCLDRERFRRTVSMLAVGLICNPQMKHTCAKLRPYFPSYIRIPKFQQTYHDVDKKLRKLMLLELKEMDKVSNALLLELKALDVDVRMSPCALESVTNEESSPSDGLQVCDHKNGDNTRNTEENVKSLSEDVPVLSLERLCEVRSPGFLRLQITYDNFSLEQVLKEILPNHVTPVTGFTVMGHVAHFNLKPDALPYRHVIGQAVIDKIANIRTVIHKAANIASDFRTFELDLMAGDPDYITSVCENQLVYHLDVSKVYWNSRLGTEHARVVAELTKCHSLDPEATNPEVSSPSGRVVVYDVFAGVGPFAIPAARLGCRVFANDLNPASFEWLKKNVHANRTSKRPLDNITCYNLDGREFIRKVLLPHYWSSVEGVPKDGPSIDATPLRYVVIMNLPGLAPDFLDAFLHPQPADELLTPNSLMCKADGDGTLARSRSGKRSHVASLPLDFYCYCFVRRNTESEDSVKQRIATALGFGTQPDLLFNRSQTSAGPVLDRWSFRFVRNVAPFKDMFCAEFQLSLDKPETTLEHTLAIESLSGVEKKKSKLDE